MKKILSIFLLGLIFIPQFVNAEILFTQEDITIESESITQGGYSADQQIKGFIISSATTTANQITIALKAEEEAKYYNTELRIRILCKLIVSTSTDCGAGQGWTGDPEISWYNNGLKLSTTTLNTSITHYNFRADYSLPADQDSETMTISPAGLYSFTVDIDPNPPYNGHDVDVYAYGSSDDISGMCWREYYVTNDPNCYWGTNASATEGDMKELGFILSYVDANDTTTRIMSLIPSSTVVETTNFSEIVNFEVTWYYNPTEWVGTTGYDQIIIAPTNIDLGLSYVPKFLPINASGQATNYVSFELQQGLHQIDACFYYSWDGTDVDLANLCKSFSLVVGTTTYPVSYDDNYDPLYGGDVPTGEVDCSALDLSERPFCYLTNALKKLFIPSSLDTNTYSRQFKESVLGKFPIGYITSVVDILDTEATTTFPIAGFTFKTDSPIDGEFSFDLGQIITDANTMVETDFTTDNSIVEADTSQNVWEMIMPTLNIIGYSMLIIFIVLELFGLSGMEFRDGSSFKGHGKAEGMQVTGIRDHEISFEKPGFSRYKRR